MNDPQSRTSRVVWTVILGLLCTLATMTVRLPNSHVVASGGPVSFLHHHPRTGRTSFDFKNVSLAFGLHATMAWFVIRLVKPLGRRPWLWGVMSIVCFAGGGWYVHFLGETMARSQWIRGLQPSSSSALGEALHLMDYSRVLLAFWLLVLCTYGIYVRFKNLATDHNEYP